MIDSSQRLTQEDEAALAHLHGMYVSFYFSGHGFPEAGVGLFQIEYPGLHTVARIHVIEPESSTVIHTHELTLPRQFTKQWMIPLEHQPHLAARFFSNETTFVRLREQPLPMARFQCDMLFAVEQEYLRTLHSQKPTE